MRVNEIMTSPVVTVDSGATLHTAVGTMLEHRVGSVVVLDSGLQGIVTRSDVLRAAYSARHSLTELSVTDAMSEDIVTTTKAASIRTVLRTMEDHNIKKLPVLDAFELVGIITTTDIAQHLPERVHEVRNVLERKDDWTD